MPYPSELEALARELDQSGDYRVLRRLIPREITSAPEGFTGKIGVIIDLETTGLDPSKDEIIEIAMVKFRYSENDEITGISGVFQSFSQPTNPIPEIITELTGITDDMVADHKIDFDVLSEFVSEANVIIAHNAVFDRRFAERAWKLFEYKPWACSATEIAWREHGFDGSRLSYLLSGVGFFHDAHRALDDCQALVEILSRPLPVTSQSALKALLSHARRPTIRIWAENSPFDFKDELKRRGYRWNDGSDGRARSWYLDVDENGYYEAIEFLKVEIYQRNVDIRSQKITALDRFSTRA